MCSVSNGRVIVNKSICQYVVSKGSWYVVSMWSVCGQYMVGTWSVCHGWYVVSKGGL